MKNNILLQGNVLPDLDELPEDMRMLAEIVGLPKTMEVAEAFGGTHINLAGYITIKKRLRDRCIRKEYDEGVTVVNISRKYMLSITRVRTILGSAEV